MNKKTKTPWPTEAVMNQIYEQHLWGGNDMDFYSGNGSHDLKIINPFIDAVTSFFKSHDNSLTVCDLGCGDFNVGKHLTNYTKKYIAVDIVDKLIDRNKVMFKEEHLEFHTLDIVEDQLPLADCAILRQVLQHLSNREIQNIVQKLTTYNFLILTEHVPTESFIPNKDMISGQGNRLKLNSGINLLESPFNLKVIEQYILNETILDKNKGKILTTLFTI